MLVHRRLLVYNLNYINSNFYNLILRQRYHVESKTPKKTKKTKQQSVQFVNQYFSKQQSTPQPKNSQLSFESTKNSNEIISQTIGTKKIEETAKQTSSTKSKKAVVAINNNSNHFQTQNNKGGFKKNVNTIIQNSLKSSTKSLRNDTNPLQGPEVRLGKIEFSQNFDNLLPQKRLREKKESLKYQQSEPLPNNVIQCQPKTTSSNTVDVMKGAVTKLFTNISTLWKGAFKNNSTLETLKDTLPKGPWSNEDTISAPIIHQKSYNNQINPSNQSSSPNEMETLLSKVSILKTPLNFLSHTIAREKSRYSDKIKEITSIQNTSNHETNSLVPVVGSSLPVISTSLSKAQSMTQKIVKKWFPNYLRNIVEPKKARRTQEKAMTTIEALRSTAVEETLANFKFWLSGSGRRGKAEFAAPQLIGNIMNGHKDGGTMTPEERIEARLKLQKLATPRNKCSTYPSSIQKIWTIGGCSPDWHKTFLSLCNPRTTKISQPVYRDMLIEETKDLLIDRLLIRYGIFKQLECRILRTKEFKNIARIWATHLVDRYEDPSQAATPYCIPDDIMEDKIVQELCAADINIYWLLYHIQLPATFDAVPQSYFPRHFETKTDQLLLDHKRVELMSKFYGLLKWPFIHLKDKKMLQNKLV